MDTPADIPILAARFKKASAMADVLDGEGITPSQAESMTDMEWQVVAAVGRARNPSAVTRALTVMLLTDREERKHRG